jgi:hypothetical protein
MVGDGEFDSATAVLRGLAVAQIGSVNRGSEADNWPNIALPSPNGPSSSLARRSMIWVRRQH